MPENFNPYQAPVATDESAMAVAGNSDRKKLISWTAVLLMNLPLPLIFGHSVVQGPGIIGMLTAVLLLLIVGVVALYRFPRLVEILKVGGIVTAVSQVLPVLHFFAGALAMGVTQQILSVHDDDSMLMPEGATFVGGFCTTTITAGIVILAAATIGVVIQFFRGRWPNPSARSQTMARIDR